MNRVDKTKGFTLVELMLAMTFISMLLVAIALTIIQISEIYNKGLTLKDINQTSILITSDFQSSIGQASPFSIETHTGPGARYVQQGSAGDPYGYWGGRLCTGQYSYIWNYGHSLAFNTSANLNTYDLSGGKKPTTTAINLIRVLDPGANYCQHPALKIDPTNAVDLLNSGDHNLAIHSFSITSPLPAAIDNATNERQYSIHFVIGTNEQSALNYDNTKNIWSCKTPAQLGADPSFCSVMTFDIVTLAGSTGE